MQKSVKTKTPRHHTKTGLLAALPVRSSLWWIVRSPVFYQLPEHFRITLFASTPKGTRQGVDETKPIGFPDDLYVTVAKVADLTPM